MDPQLQSILIIVLIGAIAGWLAGVIFSGGGYGLVGNVIIGIIGAFIGGWLFPRLGVAITPGSPVVASIITATAGALILLFILSLIRR
jgi:uncharacterized membrane protein YeaQ/YmgE (transglycosylase-associated protein family)